MNSKDRITVLILSSKVSGLEKNVHGRRVNIKASETTRCETTKERWEKRI